MTKKRVAATVKGRVYDNKRLIKEKKLNEKGKIQCDVRQSHLSKDLTIVR